MAENNLAPNGSRYIPRVVHIGAPRFASLDDRAIELSHQLRTRYTPSKIMQYLIDNYLDAATAKLAEEYKEGGERSDLP